MDLEASSVSPLCPVLCGCHGYPPQPALSPQLENAYLPVFLLPCILDLGGHPGMSGLIHIPSHFLRKHQPASGCPREMVASRGSCALTLPRLSVFSDPPHSTAPLLVLIVTFYHALVGPGVASINPHCPTTANFLQKVCSDPLTPSRTLGALFPFLRVKWIRGAGTACGGHRYSPPHPLSGHRSPWTLLPSSISLPCLQVLSHPLT